nr:hypothetical protein [Tanacetum cinerariifolium]
MVAYLNKSDASEGFNQVIDFVNGSYIKYALTVNPNIYVSCIKQFWNIVAIKQVNDVTRLQALVDKKKAVVTEATIREVLRLDDAEGVDCLPNEEIFAKLVRMGYEKPSTKLTFYKAFFSSQWKFPIHTILQSMSVKRTSWIEFSSAMTSVVICLSTVAHQKTSRDDTAACGEVPTFSQEPSIPSPTPPTQPPQPPQDLPSTSQRVDTSEDTVMDDASNQERIIDEMDKDDVVALIDDKEEDKKEEEAKVVEDDQVQGGKQNPKLKFTKLIWIMLQKRRKGVVIKDPEEESTTSSVIPADTKSKDVAIDHVNQKAKEDLDVQRYQVMKKKPQTEAQARKNMILYLKNVAGFILDYFKGMFYDDIRLIFKAKFNSNIEFLIKTKEQMEEKESRALQSINETPAQKVAKRKKLKEEVEDLKRHLEIVPDEDDDIYTEATPLARKVPVVDYEIINLNNKPYYKSIRADGTYQLYISFLALLKNFDREDLEALWSLVKEMFSTSKPKNFSDDFLLTTLGAMFEKPDGQA